MQIRPYQTGDRAAATPAALSPGQQVQAFRDMLEQARPAPVGDEQLKADFLEWKNKMAERGVQQPRLDALDANADAFLDLIKRAQRENGHADPQAFLQTLTFNERTALETIQGKVGVDEAGLSAKGAANLLRIPGKGVDADGDGMLSVGKIRLFSFPPPGAPDAVKDAWEQATEAMDIHSKVMASSAIFLNGWGTGGTMGNANEAGVSDFMELARSAIRAAEDSMRQQSGDVRAASERNIEAFKRFMVNLG